MLGYNLMPHHHLVVSAACFSTSLYNTVCFGGSVLVIEGIVADTGVDGRSPDCNRVPWWQYPAMWEHMV
jgi:hypothetical protein